MVIIFQEKLFNRIMVIIIHVVIHLILKEFDDDYFIVLLKFIHHLIDYVLLNTYLLHF